MISAARSVSIVAQIMIAVILVRKFQRKRDTAFIWLGVAEWIVRRRYSAFLSDSY